MASDDDLDHEAGAADDTPHLERIDGTFGPGQAFRAHYHVNFMGRDMYQHQMWDEYDAVPVHHTGPELAPPIGDRRPLPPECQELMRLTATQMDLRIVLKHWHKWHPAAKPDLAVAARAAEARAEAADAAAAEAQAAAAEARAAAAEARAVAAEAAEARVAEAQAAAAETRAAAAETRAKHFEELAEARKRSGEALMAGMAARIEHM